MKQYGDYEFATRWDVVDELSEDEGREKYGDEQWEWMVGVSEGSIPHDHVYGACTICGYMP